MRHKNEAVFRRNAQLYTGKTNNLQLGTKVWYLAPRKLKNKKASITDAWIGPYKVIKKISEVLIDIKPADYHGPTITCHMSRIMPCAGNNTTKQRLPKNLNLDDQGDEQAEEIRGPNHKSHDENPELGIPVRVPRPEYEIIDLPRRVQIAEPKAVQTTDPVHIPESGPAPPSPVPGPSSQQTDMDTRERDRGHKRNKDNTDSEPEERKQLKIRPKRTRDQLKGQVEKKSKREEAVIEETEGREGTETRSSFPFLPKALQRYLPSDTTDDEAVKTLQPLDVEILSGSNLPQHATPGSAAYDVRAHQNITIQANATGLVPLNLRLATPPDHFLYLLSRSGLALKGISVEGGVIDPDYSQDVKAIIRNSTGKDFKIQKGQRIAQAVFLPIIHAKFRQVDNLSNEGPHNNHRGFGSTGN